MADFRYLASRIGAALAAATLVVALDVSVALAQASSCAQLNGELQQLNRNGDFQNTDQNNDTLRALQGTMQDAQSAYNRDGCMHDQQMGAPQTPECRSYARQYLSAQSQLKRLSQNLATGDNVAQQREQVLQEIARFGCDQQNAPGGFANGGQPRHRNFLQDLFGGFGGQDQDQNGTDDYGDNGQYNGQEQVEDPYANQQQQQNTIRTVCVRMTDGYYWPVSYSTTRDYIPQDTAACQAECPGQEVDLYFYDNPGQEPEQMVNATGAAYTALPVAFAYRKQFDLSNTCKPQEVVGQISLDDLGNGQARAMVTYGGATFPLPLRDPRRVEQATALPAKYVAAINVPLPRPRPSATTTVAVTPPTAEPVVSSRSRTVKVGNKVVRLVGPDTPYAPATLPAGSSG